MCQNSMRHRSRIARPQKVWSIILSTQLFMSTREPDMKHAANRSHRIAYDLTGQGPAVVLQHGFLDNRQSWQAFGYVDALADSFTVITVDSLGHGDSDKPSDAGCYVREQRAKISGSTFSEVPGDHIAAMATSNQASSRGIRKFIESV